MTKKLFATTYTFIVLSADTPATDLSLAELDAATSTGDCVGKLSDDGGAAISGPEMAAKLTDFHSDPGFFGLADDGSDADPGEVDAPG